MHDGVRRVQQPYDALRLAVDRAAAGDVGHRSGDAKEVTTRPVGGASITTAS